MAKTIEDYIADALIEFGDGDEFRREQIVESFAENATNDFMAEIGLRTDKAFGTIYPAIAKAIKAEIDWNVVEHELTESHEDALAWFDAMQEAINE